MLERSKVLATRNKYLVMLELASPEELPYVLAGMAHAMQMALTMPLTKTVPHHTALECLMRAVAHDIEGDPEKGSYILEKAKLGFDTLRSNFS